MQNALATVDDPYVASKGHRGSCGTGKNDAGVTRARVTRKFRTKESATSRIENQAEDFRRSTLEKHTNALGRKSRVQLTDQCSTAATRAQRV